MNKVQKFVTKFDTSKMSVDELKVFVKEKLAPVMNEEWGVYEIYRTGANNSFLCYEPYCDFCYGLSEKDGICMELSDEAINYPDLDSIIITEKRIMFLIQVLYIGVVATKKINVINMSLICIKGEP